MNISFFTEICNFNIGDYGNPYMVVVEGITKTLQKIIDHRGSFPPIALSSDASESSLFRPLQKIKVNVSDANKYISMVC